MIRKKWIDILAVLSISFALLFSVTLTYFPQVFALEAKGVSMKYESELFNKNEIMTVDILMSDEDWEDMLANAASEEYYSCDVVVNGVTYYNVGIRPKGNTSLTQIISDDMTDRYSFKLEFDHYDSTQTCMGLDKLVLNNMMSDATYRKEYLAYDIMNYLGVETSLYSYANVSRNGENWGLYFALEAMEESYAERVFGSSYGELYKPESLGMGGGGGSSQGSDLAYIDDEIDSYNVIFDAAVFDPSDKDKERVIEALKNLSTGTDLEKYIDVDSMLRYIASNTFLINDDSYFGTMLHNYYLYEEDGKLTMLPWDYNLAFGGFQSHDASAVINRGIDDVVSGGDLEDRPMIGKLLEVEEYKEQYYAYLDELISGYFESGYFTELMDMLDELISSYVAEDPTAFYTYEEYTEANEMLRLFCEKRAESVRKQLDGTLEKTAASQTSENKVDASDINISVMGTQGGGEKDMADGRGGFPQNMDRTSDDTAQAAEAEKQQMPEGMQQMPEGMQQMPEGMQQSPEGMQQSPEGMQQSPEGMQQMPEGMQQMPEGGQQFTEKNNAAPEDIESPDTENAEGQQDNTDAMQNFHEGGRGDFSQGMKNGGFGEFQGGFPGENGSQGTDNTWLWIGISVLVMLAGLVAVKLYPKSRF